MGKSVSKQAQQGQGGSDDKKKKKKSDRENGGRSGASSSSGGSGGNLITQVQQHQQAQITNDLPYNLSPVNPEEYASLLPDASEQHRSQKRMCLVLDLDETLVHSSFKPVAVPDLVLPVVIKGNVHQVYVRKRPFVHEFMARMAEIFEVVIFTASLSEYADPLLDELDPTHTQIHHRLFREHCSNANGLFVKDMSLMGRDLSQILIIDNSPTSFLFQPRNSIQCTSWFDDPKDTELQELIPILEELAGCDSVYDVLDRLREQTANGGAWSLAPTAGQAQQQEAGRKGKKGKR